MHVCVGQIVTKICGGTDRPASERCGRQCADAVTRGSATSENVGSGDSPFGDSPSSTHKFGIKSEMPVLVDSLPEIRTDPITVDTLQGDWLNSSGAKINVSGTQVTLNGHLMAAHPVRLNDDGTVQCVGSIWQLWGWAPGGKIEFKEGPSLEAARYARSVLWSKMDGAAAQSAWEKHMTNLGYAGSALGDITKRGVEGCRPGSCDAYRSSEPELEEDVSHLSDAISKWRIPGLHHVRPALTIPDFSNRSHTGISVEHMHYLAKSFMDKGFQKRDNASHKGHDMPVVVLEKPSTEWGAKSIENWRSKVVEDDGFPPISHYEKTFRAPELYTTLGNGHFFQALNLVGTECSTINESGDKHYSIGKDSLLADAINTGVPSIVLKTETPMEVRQLVSRLLNSKREYRWKMTRNGSFQGVEEDTSQVSQFVAMSKVLDAVELNCLVRAELGVNESGRIGK